MYMVTKIFPEDGVATVAKLQICKTRSADTKHYIAFDKRW